MQGQTVFNTFYDSFENQISRMLYHVN